MDAEALYKFSPRVADAENWLTLDVENTVIGWRSLVGSDVVTAGSVNFDAARDGRLTQVSVHLQYAPPAGKAGVFLASLFGREPSQTIREDLRRFRQLLEAGEIARGTATGIGDHHASRLLEGTGKIQVETVADPAILNPRDAIIKVTTTAICGSDLHIYVGISRRCSEVTCSATSSWVKWSRSAAATPS